MRIREGRIDGRAVEVERSTGRTTPSPVSRRFREVLAGAGEALLDGVEVASGLAGGPVASAAVRDGVGAARGALGGGAGAESPEAPGAAPGAGVAAGGAGDTVREALAANQTEAMKFLELQQRISAENRRYTALSNVMKARHETAKSAINNIR